jgi:TonB-dependent SusC/RagA subfamily outer membrane receptor
LWKNLEFRIFNKKTNLMKPSLLFLLLFIAISSFAQNDFYNSHWQKVYSLEARGLPQSASPLVDEIYRKAKAENNTTQIVKALMYQSKFVLGEQNAELYIIERWKAESLQAKPPLKNILEFILANLYWQHFQDNRWNYYNRSRTNEVVNPNDFRTWDGKQLHDAIHLHFQNSLIESDRLKTISLGNIDEILTKAEYSRLFRPTLFDFFAHNAIDYYAANDREFGTLIDENLNNPAYIDDINLVPVRTQDKRSIDHAVVLFKQLLEFHRNDKDPAAYVNLQIEWMQFLLSHGEFSDPAGLQKQTLRKLIEQYRSDPASAQPASELANILLEEGLGYVAGDFPQHRYKKREALEICNDIIQRFPATRAAERSRVMKQNIESKNLKVVAESFLPIQTQFLINVEYQNADRLYFSIYKTDPSFMHDFRIGNNDSVQHATIVSMTPVEKWNVNIQDPQDYQMHSTEVAGPKLPAGNYLIVVRLTDDTHDFRNMYAFEGITVTNIALIESSFTDVRRFQVVDRNTGAPLQGAKVHFKALHSGDDSTSVDVDLVTDKNGFIERKPTKKGLRFIPTIKYLNEEVTFPERWMSANYYSRRSDVVRDEPWEVQTFLFTDRSIYRPGQTIHFKGIMIKRKGNKSAIVQGQFLDVYLEDPMGNEVAALRPKSNSYGSFSGEFVIPASGLTGEYTLYADEDIEDTSRFYDNLGNFYAAELTISVEEYKRPTFEVKFNDIVDTYKLNDTVKVSGKAEAFSGSKISNAMVNYKVIRNVRFPGWFHAYSHEYHSDAEIAVGEVTTEMNGEFLIKFPALPEPAASKDGSPVFEFVVTCDVTDINGETRSGTQRVNVANHSLIAELQVPSTIDKNSKTGSINVKVENLNGKAVPSKGTISIYKAVSATRPKRNRPWEAPDLPILKEEEFETLFPNDSYHNESKPLTPDGDKLMAMLTYDTNVSKEVKFNIDERWLTGHYVVELKSADKDGISVYDKASFRLIDITEKGVPDNRLFVLETDKLSYYVGDVARVKVGSASPDMTITLDLEKEQKVTKTWVENYRNNTREFLIPVTAEMDNGFSIHASGVNMNSFFIQTKNIPILKKEESLELETITFKDKLQPGAKETWSFAVKGKDQGLIEAEVLASMYDASLDQFREHHWEFDPIRRSSYYSYSRILDAGTFGIEYFTTRNHEQVYYSQPQIYYDELDWFGFSITNNYAVRKAYIERLYSTGVASDEPSKVSTSRDKNLRKGVVRGTITSAEDGTPIPGVNVLIKGTKNGTVTDMSGRYTIAANKGDVIVYTFIGFSSTEVKVAAKNIINVAMSADVTELSEVVVTALGISHEKKLLSYSIQEVVSDTTASDIVLSKAMAGSVAGVQARIDGYAYNLQIRGQGKLSDKNGPALYVVDGVVVESQTIDQSEIANIQVLTGDAAITLYGSRAANGVIVINTKAGQKKLDEEMAKVTARKNFNETAFFFPHLTTDESGRIRFTFTAPESLTRWKLQLLAHTTGLQAVTKQLQAITQKEFMVTPNVPRFLRVGDEIIISAKISNLTTKEKKGNAALQLTNAVNGQPVDALLQNVNRNIPFAVAGKGSMVVSWKLKIPEGIDAVQYKVLAKSGNFSDGEQNALPVLSNRILVTETMPMHVRAGQTKTFTLEKLKTNTSTTLQHHQLTLEGTSNPAWYAVQGLPYLMEFPYECAEQLFARYYANSLGKYLIDKNPKVRTVFESWASSKSNVSPLEKNPELKSILIQETPWLRDAQDEAEQNKRLALLFDLNSLAIQQDAVIDKLKKLQLDNGGFAWFEGGIAPSRYITSHIATGLGRMSSLEIKMSRETNDLKTLAVQFLDQQIVNDHQRILLAADNLHVNAKEKDEGTKLANAFLAQQHISYDQIQYLYLRSYCPDSTQREETKKAITFYRQQAAQHWLKFNVYMKGMLAIAFDRANNKVLSKRILQSLNENSIKSDELGMYWKENQSSWYWYEAPIETQALLIEAFSEIDWTDPETKQKTIDELRLWLVKNKQVSQWKTTKATTEAVYAMLIKGDKWLPVENELDVFVGGKQADPGKSAESAAGYFKTTWQKKEVLPAMAEVKITKKEQGSAWAALYWQYFEDIDKITPSESPLKISKKVFLVGRDASGEVLNEVNPDMIVPVGDLIRIRLELKVDRPMEFLHLKDMRASGLEPVSVLSGYKHQEGLWYYQSTRDAATNFFFDFMPPGVYVFEYDLRANNAGEFSNGIATIQCMYAPEFGSSSESVKVKIGSVR